MKSQSTGFQTRMERTHLIITNMLHMYPSIRSTLNIDSTFVLTTRRVSSMIAGFIINQSTYNTHTRNGCTPPGTKLHKLIHTQNISNTMSSLRHNMPLEFHFYKLHQSFPTQVLVYWELKYHAGVKMCLSCAGTSLDKSHTRRPWPTRSIRSPPFFPLLSCGAH
jgi:hypothetical protein